MAKIKQVNLKKKMADIITERRKAGDPLKRSKSVRASLRFIGSKLLNHKSNDNSISKVKSLSNLSDFKNKSDFKRSISHDESYLYGSSNIFITKQPITNSETVATKPEKIKMKKKNKIKITTPPLRIAPKAAQILEIPIKENLEPLSLQCEPFWRYDDKSVSDTNGNRVNADNLNVEYRRAFHRNTLRLSLAPSKRKNFRNTLASEPPSEYSFLTFLCFFIKLKKM